MCIAPSCGRAQVGAGSPRFASLGEALLPPVAAACCCRLPKFWPLPTEALADAGAEVLRAAAGISVWSSASDFSVNTGSLEPSLN